MENQASGHPETCPRNGARTGFFLEGSMKRRMLMTLCVGLALAAGSLVVPASAGNKSSGRSLKFETTAVGNSLKVKARGTAVGPASAEKIHIEIESKMLGSGGTV